MPEFLSQTVMPLTYVCSVPAKGRCSPVASNAAISAWRCGGLVESPEEISGGFPIYGGVMINDG